MFPSTWRGPADASGRTPRGHGVLVYDEGEVYEGAMDDAGRRQGQWACMTPGGRPSPMPGVLTARQWWSIQYVDDGQRDSKVRPLAPSARPPATVTGLPCACCRGWVRGGDARRGPPRPAPDARGSRQGGRGQRAPPAALFHPLRPYRAAAARTCGGARRRFPAPFRELRHRLTSRRFRGHHDFGFLVLFCPVPISAPVFPYQREM
jgi:hypothetical protein